jgi:transcription initiation factor TFIIIB Brf1 subunit/transcription initiation factor TFIIB
VSSSIRLVLCPTCDEGKFYIEDWGDRIAVVCRKCGCKIRELDISLFEGLPRWEWQSEVADRGKGEAASP